MQLTRRSALAALGGAAFGATMPRLAFAQAMPATMAYGSTGYTWAGAFVAEGIDAWAKNGIALQALDFPTGRESMQALLGGSADFATATDTPVTFAGLRGLKPMVIAVYSRYSRDMKIAVRDGAATTDDPASLKGKTIATRVGTSGQYMLSRYLTMAGLSDADVTIVDLSPSDMMAATLRGDVDGFSWTSQASAMAVEAAGGQIVEMTQEGIEEFFVSHQCLLTNEAVLADKPELAEGAVKAILDAEAYITGNDTWPEVIADRVRAEPDFIKTMTSVFEFRTELSKKFLTDLITQAEWAISAGLVEKPEGDVAEMMTSLIAPGPLMAVAPDRVTL
ncbi:ABC transporter substrate-binding protein [Acuticoccus kandeliae]|uniref:ABC transporter substrate-binding protein n=1 Tax=Acuticoccus kandeliae TaxID=2073160 RepID=UPI000D3EE232|nr:NrtA/SsuA/CpmA family ABC transporter substrate-binding protein [Acuticoccus kandeliae]